jgi:hypothetical protein
MSGEIVIIPSKQSILAVEKFIKEQEQEQKKLAGSMESKNKKQINITIPINNLDKLVLNF